MTCIGVRTASKRVERPSYGFDWLWLHLLYQRVLGQVITDRDLKTYPVGRLVTCVRIGVRTLGMYAYWTAEWRSSQVVRRSSLVHDSSGEACHAMYACTGYG